MDNGQDKQEERDYGLPHENLRPGQAGAIDWCLNLEGVGVIEAPTGSGKTSYAAGVGNTKSVIALCRTKNLQSENYGRVYEFDVLFGKGNYECVHEEALLEATAADCLHNSNMYECPHVKSCPYVVQKEIAKQSDKASLNYAYYLSAKWPRQNPASCLVLDEAHELHKVVTDWAGCTITEKDRKTWELPEFPELRPRKGGGMMINESDPVPEAVEWLNVSRDLMVQHWLRLRFAETKEGLREKRRAERLGRKLRATRDALVRNNSEWYIKSGKRAAGWGSRIMPGFVAKPLTAKHHFPGYFINAPSTILMSATIGELGAFTEELGIEDYTSLTVENQFPPDSRSVYALDVPSMGAKASEIDFNHQADEIARSILDCPYDWPGLVLVTRKAEAGILADRLARRGLEDRVWVTPGGGDDYVATDRQVIEWEQRKSRVPNSICITWSFWVGYDGVDEKICIAAKVPYPLWGSGSSFEAAWRAYSMQRYLWQAGNTLAQGLGRTRRGRPEDYDLGDEFNGFVAIADGSWRRVKNSLPQSLKESVIDA